MKRGTIAWVEEGLRRSGKTKSGLAKALGVAPSAVTAILQGKRRLRADEIDIIAGYLEMRDSVPIVGLGGAGPDGSVAFADPGGHLGEAPIPPDSTAQTVAIEVRGDSMRGIADNGWLVYYDDRRDPPTDDLAGHLCVVGLTDGRILIKKMFRGRKRRHFDLESVGAPTIHDARVEWAARVTAIVPR